MSDLILASKSPRRQELISKITDSFEVIVSDADEILPEGISPDDAPVYLASVKARAVAAQHKGRVVIGADTVVVLDGRILGKPKNAEDAFSMLRSLSGKIHTVITGCCITDGERELCFSEHTKVEFYPLTDDEIRRYIATREPMDKAGAYGIQGEGALFVKGIEGDYFNVMGLPVAKLYRKIGEFEKG